MSGPASPKRWRAALLLLLAVTGPPIAAGASDLTGPTGPATPEATLHVDWATDGAVTGGALAAWAALELAKDGLTPAACRWCAAPGLDVDVRRALAWSNPGAAKAGADVLLVAIPAGFAGYDLLATRDAGGLWRSAEDVLVVAEAVALTGLVTDVAKYAVARQRPYATGVTGALDAESRVSFWSEHTSLAFAAAAASGSVAQLRGYPGWGWVYGVGFGAAAATGYLRLAADQHWLTDVVAGAAAGSAMGFLVPWLHRQTAVPGAVSVLVLPSRIVLAGQL